jgi:hypothetical protein
VSPYLNRTNGEIMGSTEEFLEEFLEENLYGTN